MKLTLCSLVFTLLLFGCAQQEQTKKNSTAVGMDENSSIPNIHKEKSKLIYDNNTSIWSLDDQPFSGYAVTYHPDSTLSEKVGILKGKKQSEATTWYPDQHKKRSATYHNGKLHGPSKTWSPDSTHILVSHLNYQNGKAHGIQKKWYPTGEIFKILQLNMGIEEGIQQAYRKNGDLFANYEARDGRFFGLRKNTLCYGLEDEKIKYEN